MTIGITNHSKQRINRRFPQLKDLSFSETRKYFLQLINQSLIIYHEPINNTNVYIGVNFKLILTADNRHKLVTVISI
jgi:hypothetical protein